MHRASTSETYAESFRLAIGTLFERFKAKGAGACAISLPPDFAPLRSTPKRAVTPIRRALHGMDLRPEEHDEIRRAVFWTLAEFCSEFKMPFDLMIGPIRNVYPAGVAGGRDLFDRRVSLHDYRDLFNHFADVTFPVSTLSPDAGAELVAYSWIFPNVVPNGHWWYSNIPPFIAADLRARGSRPSPRRSRSAITPTPTSSNSSCPSSPCTGRSSPRVLADDGIRGPRVVGRALPSKRSPADPPRQPSTDLRAVVTGLGSF